MKKLLGILAIAALASSAFAQGTVIFANASTAPVKQWTTSDNSAPVTVPKGTAAVPAGYVQLFAADQGTPFLNPLFSPEALTPNAKLFAKYTSLAGFLAANPGWQNVATTRLTTLTAGVFGGGTVSITGVAPSGAAANYFIIGWTGNFANFDAALTAALANQNASFMNMTPILTTATGDPLASPPGAPVNLSGTFPANFTLAPVFVPEPSTFALAGLGIAAMLVLRRRK